MNFEKKENPANEVIAVRLTPKLKEQLQRYAQSNNKFLSQQARDILKKHLEEETPKD